MTLGSRSTANPALVAFLCALYTAPRPANADVITDASARQEEIVLSTSTYRMRIAPAGFRYASEKPDRPRG